MSAQVIDPRAEVDTPAHVTPAKSGEADPSMTVSSDTQISPNQVIEALLVLRREQSDKAESAAQTIYEIDRAIARIIREANIDLPFSCDTGVVKEKRMKFYSDINRGGILTPSQRRQSRRETAKVLSIQCAA